MSDIILQPPGDSSIVPAICPFTVIVDTREQTPFAFADFRTDARDGGRPLVIPTRTGTLRSGDYSIDGHQHAIAIERKSLADAYGTIGRGRRRFERLLARMNTMLIAEVVIESGWEAALTAPPVHTKLPPKIVFRSIIAWKQRYRNVHWTFAGSRRLAEVMTFRMLERYWKESRTCDARMMLPDSKKKTSRQA